MRVRGIGAILIVIVGALVASSSALAAPTPGWSFDSVAVPTNFVPGPGNEAQYQAVAANLGGSATDGSPITLTDTLPIGLSVAGVTLELRTPLSSDDFGPQVCTSDESGARAVVTCEITPVVPGAETPTIVKPGESLSMVVHVDVPAELAGPLVNEATIEGGGTAARSTTTRNAASSTPAPPGLSEFRAAALDESARPFTQAGGYPPQYVTTYAVNTEPGPPGGADFAPAGGNVKDIEVDLPPGLVGNPTASSTCGPIEFGEAIAVQRPSGIGQNFNNGCPSSSQVGYIEIRQLEGEISQLHLPIFELQAPRGMPAQLGFQLFAAPFYIDTRVRTGSDYGVTAYLPNLSQIKRATSARVVLWGVPGAASHDSLRGECLNQNSSGAEGVSSGSCPATITPRAFLSNSTSCASPQVAAFSFDTWLSPGAFHTGSSESPTNTGCGAVPFNASLSARPQTTAADSPTGLEVDLHVEQNQGASGVVSAHLRDATVALPAGLTVNPSSATGLTACSPAEVGLTSTVGSGRATFDAAAAECPAASKLGTVEIDTPLLDHPVEGSVYLASQGQNPFGSLIALYIAADDERTGVVVKLAGEVEANPSSGQLTARFTENPQLPFEDLRMHFFEGPAASLRTPTTCGTYATNADLKPWSAPQSGPDVVASDSFAVTSAANGGPCARTEAELPNAPGFQAGAATPLAGAFSSFALRLSRDDGTQPLSIIDTTLPAGLLGRLAGIPYCSDAALAAAAANSGRAEGASPSCPQASQVGTVDAAAGAGPRPFHVGGEAYLAGPYKGAPLSLAIVTPAVAGPLDLGTVVVRTALYVNETTARVHAVSDPIPQILRGIPLDLRAIDLQLNRPRFTLNPTNCEPMQVLAGATSVFGQVASLASPFQVGGCKGLDFAPKLKLGFSGQVKRLGHPALKAVLTQPQGENANIARTTVILPKGELIDNAHINSPCTRVQFNEGGGKGERCPAASILGTARAWTPLLDQPLEGPVFFRSNGGERKLPDLVVELRGQIDVQLVGFIDSVRQKGSEVSRVRTRFQGLPDAPVSRFELKLKGGKRGLLINSKSLCANRAPATLQLGGQNGKAAESTQKPQLRCARSKKGSGSAGAKKS